MIKLLKSEITSFVGDIVPVKLESDSENLMNADIKWSLEGDCVTVRGFSGKGGHSERFRDISFNDGVLVTLKEPGEAVVTAEYKGEKYQCRITSEALHETPEELRNAEPGYFFGDLHDHVTPLHNHVKFTEEYASGTTTLPKDLIDYVRTGKTIDFCAISDHASTIHDRMFFDGFVENLRAQPMQGMVFPGSESEVSNVEYDRYGIPNKNSGEIVMLFTDAFCNSKDWETYLSEYSNSETAVGIFAHPQVVGHSVPGIWHFALDKNRSKEFRDRIRMVEMGNGGIKDSNIINEYIYSSALDNGYKVSVTSSSDAHGARWGNHPGKTIIMSHERTREGFYRAMRENRVYASESGNVRVWYTVNGQAAPCTIADGDKMNKYTFRVSATTFVGEYERPLSAPVKCQVISDYGKCLATLEKVDLSDVTFTVESSTARYFYLRFTDVRGKKTWSCPVWTGREFDETVPSHTGQYVVGKADRQLEPIPKDGFTAIDELSGKSACELINDDIEGDWTNGRTTASIVIDMQTERKVRGVGHYPVKITRAKIAETNVNIFTKLSTFAAGYKISVSRDGKYWDECADGLVRIYGAEVIAAFEERSARYVKFEVTSTVGKLCDIPDYADAEVALNELTVFE